MSGIPESTELEFSNSRICLEFEAKPGIPNKYMYWNSKNNQISEGLPGKD